MRSRDRFRGYNRLVLGLVGTFVLYAAYLALTLEPITGDLTRVGGLPERDYGWLGEKPRFVPELFQYQPENKPLKSAQVLVLGDSFSHQSRYGFGWQNYFVARTGLSLRVFSLHHYDAMNLLDNPVFANNPPELVIFQSSELSLHERLMSYRGDCSAPRRQLWPPIPVEPVPYETQPFSRSISMGWDPRGRIDQAMHVIKLGAAAMVGHSAVTVLTLGGAPRFTSHVPSLLAYGYAIPRDDWRSVDMDALACGWRNLRGAVQRKLGAPLVGMFVPTNLSVYAPDIPGSPASYQGYIPDLLKAGNLDVPDLNQPLRQAVDQGLLDVYLPNDSHWSNIGHQIAADVLYEYLIERGLIAPAEVLGTVLSVSEDTGQAGLETE